MPALEPTQSDPTATPTPEAHAEARPSDREALPAAFLLPAFLRPDAIPGAALSPGYPYTLEEAASIEISSSPDWWVSSGARVDFDSVTTGRTIQGELAGADRWRLIYGGSNPVDTDDGYHPQNILRLVRRSRWQNFRQEAYFRINRLHHSSSPNRNQSNGLLLFHRYQSSQTL
ncbi:MAG: hypothetical protein ACREQY_15320, partial [Candidatus Binatia bacterium]